MAKYLDRQSILDAVLNGYGQYGFNLVTSKEDDTILELYFKDKRIATYNQMVSTPEKPIIELIREGCQNYLDNIMRSI